MGRAGGLAGDTSDRLLLLALRHVPPQGPRAGGSHLAQGSDLKPEVVLAVFFDGPDDALHVCARVRRRVMHPAQPLPRFPVGAARGVHGARPAAPDLPKLGPPCAPQASSRPLLLLLSVSSPHFFLNVFIYGISVIFMWIKMWGDSEKTSPGGSQHYWHLAFSPQNCGAL